MIKERVYYEMWHDGVYTRLIERLAPFVDSNTGEETQKCVIVGGKVKNGEFTDLSCEHCVNQGRNGYVFSVATSQIALINAVIERVKGYKFINHSIQTTAYAI